jgi:hypothetical protein
MIYIIIYLYFFGTYMSYTLSNNIIHLEGDDYETVVKVTTATLWPVIAPYYLVKKVSARARGRTW